MPFTFDEGTCAISLPVGDTADIYIGIDWAGLADGDAVLFAIYGSQGDVFVKPAMVEKGWAHVRLCNADTRSLTPGRYNWQLRIVTDPARDDDGNIIADDCTDNVITVFNRPPMLELARLGAHV